MDHFRETAVGLTIWYAFLVLLSGLLLIILKDLDARAACLAGADIALLFALGLVVRSRQLNEQSIVRCQFWRALPASERPHGAGGRRVAYSMLERVWLHSAKGAAAIAIVLCGLALASNHAATTASAERLPVAVSYVD
jgi:hypothetical protein